MARRDNRLYAQLTLDYLDSHKIAILSDSAIVAHIRMILWSRRLMTDGRIPEKMALLLAKRRPKILAELTSNDVDAPSLVKVGTDYILHDFAEHQTTRADIEHQSLVNTANGQRGGRPKVNRNETEPVSETEPKKSQRQSTETETHSSTKSGARRRPETSLPADWEPKPAHVLLARERGVDGRHEEAQFRAHAQANDRRQRDWDAAFRMWLGNSKPGRRAKEDQIVDVLEQGRALLAAENRKALE